MDSIGNSAPHPSHPRSEEHRMEVHEKVSSTFFLNSLLLDTFLSFGILMRIRMETF